MNIDRRSFLSGSVALVGASLVSRGSANAAGVSDLDFASAVTVARAIRAREVSSVEITTRLLDRIQRYNPQLNAIVTLTADSALGRARAADEALARGEWWGPFHGVPCTIKDTFETSGVRTTAGNPSFASHVPTRDAAVVERVRRSGAIILGKTNVPLMAADWQSYNSVFGVTSNPWNQSRTPGGSSGGEAAALAAGLTFLSVGSDRTGSIRIPAHFCGIYGHRPSQGVVPSRGHIPPAPTGPPSPPSDLAVAGPLARTAGDLRALLEVLGGPDRDDAIAYRWSLPPSRVARLTECRLGFVLDDPTCPVSSDIGDVVRHAVEALRKAGARLDEGWPRGVVPAEQYEACQYLLDAERARAMRDEDVEALRRQAARNDGSSGTKRALAWTAPHRSFLAATSRRMAARTTWREYFRTHDAFLLPTALVAAFPHDHSDRDSRLLATSSGPQPYQRLAFWISFATLTGLPATTAPIGLTRNGLPVGIQIIGPHLEDATPIEVAARLADLVGGFRPPTGYLAP